MSLQVGSPPAIEHFFSQAIRAPCNAYGCPQLGQNGSPSATEPPQAAVSPLRV